MKEVHKEYGGVLPCGGKGNRLLSISEDRIPKSLLRVGGKELMLYSVEAMPPDIVSRLVFAIDYRADDIRQWVYRANLPHIIEFSEQIEPGVLGAIKSGVDFVQEDSVVACNTDEIRLGINLEDVVRFHEAQGTLATMLITYATHLYRHRIIEVGERDNIIVKTRLKPEEYYAHPEKIGLINTGFIIFDKRALEYFDPGHSYDWGGIIDPLCYAGQLSAYINPKIIYFNVGTPEEYQEAETYLSK